MLDTHGHSKKKKDKNKSVQREMEAGTERQMVGFVREMSRDVQIKPLEGELRLTLQILVYKGQKA